MGISIYGLDKKNPLVEVEKEVFDKGSAGEIRAVEDNVRFAWRPLEVSNRLQDQTIQFLLYQISPSFTPEFLTEFLVNYHRHAQYIMGNYSEQGNHLLFEAQRMVYAGTFFPEFKEASVWRQSGIDILNREVKNRYIQMADNMNWILIIILPQLISFLKLYAWLE